MFLSFRFLVAQESDDSVFDIIKFGTNADLSDATKFENNLCAVKQSSSRSC